MTVVPTPTGNTSYRDLQLAFLKIALFPPEWSIFNFPSLKEQYWVINFLVCLKIQFLTRQTEAMVGRHEGL